MREEEVNLSHAYSQYGTNDGSGRLKIFFGYAAGVGKTYAMLRRLPTRQSVRASML